MSYAEKYGFHDDDVDYTFKSQKGVNEDIVRQISAMKDEPQWMTDRRVEAYHIFMDKPTPQWGGDLNRIDYDDIYYYVRATDKTEDDWEEVPQEIKDTFDKLGIPEAEQKFLHGVSAQYDSESVYHKIQENLEEQGVIFLDMDSGLREHPEIIEEYFGTVIPIQRQQVRRPEHRCLVRRQLHLCAARRACRNAAAGLFPHQHAEHGSVRAHPHHRR